MRESVSAWRIFCTDDVVMFLVILTAMFVAAEILIVLTPAPHDPFVPSLPTVALLIAAPLPFALPAVWWIRVTQRVLTEGRSSPGVITAIEASDHYVVRYVFEADGQEEKGAASSTGNRRLKRLTPGMPVTVCYDPSQRKHRFVLELYVEGAAAT